MTDCGSVLVVTYFFSLHYLSFSFFFFFFFNDTATTEIYTLSLHDALPISTPSRWWCTPNRWCTHSSSSWTARSWQDRKSTRLNSSHGYISYAVFCLKKKKKKNMKTTAGKNNNVKISSYMLTNVD